MSELSALPLIPSPPALPSPLTPLPRGEGEAHPSRRASGAPQDEGGPSPLAPLPEGEGNAVGPGRPPAAFRFPPGRSGNRRGRPRKARHLGALVAEALRERTAVADGGGHVRRFTKLEATVRQIVDGAAAGDARSIKLLFALFKTDERALAEPETRRAGAQDAADALVVAEIVRRFGEGAQGRPSPARNKQGDEGGQWFLAQRPPAKRGPGPLLLPPCGGGSRRGVSPQVAG